MVILSIALLTKNSERTVKWALRSLLSQYIPKELEFELIVVDGYSRDSTLDIVENYCEKLQRRFSTNFTSCKIYKERVGVGFARNVALQRALGKWILWLDSDVILGYNYILAFWRELSTENLPANIAVLYPRKVLPILRGFKSKVMFCQSHIGISSSSQRSILCLPYTAMQGVFTLKHALLDVGGFNSKLIAAEDVDIYTKLLVHGYAMESFNGTIYVIPRKTFKEFFKQAMVWNYGLIVALSENPILQREVMGKKTYTGLLVQSLEGKHYFKFLPRIIVEVLRSMIKNFNDATKYCGIYALPALIAYLYRRLGYSRGIVLTYNHLTRLQHRR